MHPDTKAAAEAGERFAADTTDHKMTVHHDDGLYRHLVFRDPKSSFYWYELITWPGALTFRGDMGTWTFGGVSDNDLVEFFHRGSKPAGTEYRINPGYWSQKTAEGTQGCRRYSEDLFKEAVTAHLDEFINERVKEGDERWTTAALAELRDQVNEEFFDDWTGVALFSRDSAINAASNFHFKTDTTPRPAALGYQPLEFSFYEPYDWTIDEFDHTFLWACHGIITGIETYLAAKNETSDEKQEAAA